jgi:hypothetical protein
MINSHKLINIECNGVFLLIKGSNQCGAGFSSSKEMNTYLHSQCTNEEFGSGINSELLKCKYYEYSKDMFDFLTKEEELDTKERLQYVKRTYGYKKESDMYKNMMSCWIELNNKRELEITPFKQKKSQVWVGIGKETHIHLKSNIPPDLLGAAVRFAFTRCQGKGRDIVVNALFPDGEPNSLEKYLESVETNYKNWLISG